MIANPAAASSFAADYFAAAFSWVRKKMPASGGHNPVSGQEMQKMVGVSRPGRSTPAAITHIGYVYRR